MDLRRCRNAAIAATKWLLSQQGEDGSFSPIEHGMATHNKLLWALGDMGQQPKAARLAAWLRESALDGEGDFGGLARPEPYDHFFAVGNAFLAAGAMRLGHFALAYPALGLLSSLQHPETGGFLTAGPDAGLDDEQDVLTTASCGQACLQGGQLGAAEAAGRFLLDLWEGQPGGGGPRLFTSVCAPCQVVTEFPPEYATRYAVETGQREQGYHVPALAAGFLTCLYDATGDASYLEGAHTYLQFLDSCAEDRFTSERSGFVAWATSLAYEVTGSASYQRMAEAAAEGLLVTQLQNGSWLKGSLGADLTSDVVDATAEGIIVLNQVMRSLVAAED